MKIWLWAGLFAAVPAFAQETAPTPVRLGYVFEDPVVRLHQRIFGLAHGVHLLLSACLDKNENAAAALAAYESWHLAQGETLDAVRQALAEHHFGTQAAQVQWQDIARVLGLKETVYPSLGETPLPEACATLPQALAQPRYDFATQLKSTDDPSRQ